MTYQTGVNDRIESKSDAGFYSYQSNSNHRLENLNQNLGSPSHDITYTGIGKVATITETGSINKVLTLTYGVDNQRFSAVYKENGGANLY